MNVLRTPDERFANLPGWPYAPKWWQHDGMQLHHVDEGPREAAVTALCLHGEPTWGYLYRRMIPVFAGAGLRVVVPDFFGFGRSDKPDDDGWYSFERHRNALIAFIEALDLRNVLLVVQDWGGLIGLTLPLAMPDRITRVMVMNTGLGTGTVTPGFRQWRDYANQHPDLAVGKLMQRACPHLSEAEAAAYDAPFPDVAFKAGVRAFPNLVPAHADAPGAALSREALAFWRERWKGAAYMAIGMQDPVLGPDAMRPLHAAIRGAAPPLEVSQAGHFVPEWGEPLARGALHHFGLERPHVAA